MDRIVARTGFEPVVSALRGRRPKPLDERACILLNAKLMPVFINLITAFSIFNLNIEQIQS